MEKISKFQFIQLNKRVAIRYYNVRDDKFEKICIADEIKIQGKLLIADGRFYYEYGDNLFFVAGKQEDVKPLLRDDKGVTVVGILDVRCKPLPFPFLLVEFRPENGYDSRESDCYLIKNYSEVNAVVTLPDGRRFSYWLKDCYDELGQYEGYFLEKRIIL